MTKPSDAPSPQFAWGSTRFEWTPSGHQMTVGFVGRPSPRVLNNLSARLERLLGREALLHVDEDGVYLTDRNLWNLSPQMLKQEFESALQDSCEVTQMHNESDEAIARQWYDVFNA